MCAGLLGQGRFIPFAFVLRKFTLMRFSNRWCCSRFSKSLCVLSMLSTFSIALAISEIPSAKRNCERSLVIHWQAQTERTLTGPSNGRGLSPHTKQRTEVITIRVGDRVVERIDANDVDFAAAEKLVLSPSGGSKSPKLGIEMARKKAQSTVARYAKLGRTAVIEELNQPITYLIAASDNGAVRALNAETGELFWSATVGKHSLPTWGPGVNDQFVTLANGMDLYVLDLMNGRVLTKKRLTRACRHSPAHWSVGVRSRDQWNSRSL